MGQLTRIPDRFVLMVFLKTLNFVDKLGMSCIHLSCELTKLADLQTDATL